MHKSWLCIAIFLLSLTACLQRKLQSGSSSNGLQKISWIQGNWKGLYKGAPFYEIYRLHNDSILEITSYEWTGKDSTKTSRSWVRLHHGTYYLGDSLNWKVTAITDSAIHMVPHYKASNTIVWKRRDHTGWDAILKSPRGEVVYHMEKAGHF